MWILWFNTCKNKILLKSLHIHNVRKMSNNKEEVYFLDLLHSLYQCHLYQPF